MVFPFLFTTTTEPNTFKMIFTNPFVHNINSRNLYFKFWANCLLVKGYRNALVCDVFRGRYVKVSHLFYKIFKKYGGMSLDSLYHKFQFQAREGYLKMLQYFVENDFAIYTDERETLPDLPMAFSTPFEMLTAIIVFNSDSDVGLLENSITSLTNLDCQAIRIIDLGRHFNLPLIRNICNRVEKSTTEYIDIFSNYYRYLSPKFWTFLKENARIRQIHYYNFPRRDSIVIEKTKQKIHYHSCGFSLYECGGICVANMVINLPFFTESQHHNTCLNRKICIDENGDIKNCPAMEKSYGNIRDTTLKEAIEKPGFKECWTICKDQIDVCKDCEFRYMCTDCRAFIKDPANPYSQPAKCTYNPYICLWEGQDGYVPVEECGTYSRETGFVPDKKKITKLNKKIWGEAE